MAGLPNLVNEWLVRGLVLLSLAAHILLIPFAGIRRHKASGGPRAILWLAYQLADWVATFTIGKLFLGSSTSREQQLVAFWLPFLLMHLGRPDNINAYSLEDNALSARQVVEAFTQVVGAGYVLYNNIIIGGGGGTFLAASVIMFCVGITKYVERVWALWLADLGSIRSSGKMRPAPSLPRFLWRDSEQDLLVAHDLFHITEGAFADYTSVKGAFADYSSVDEDPLNPTRIDRRWPHGWEKIYKVVEMELSIMYDVLYTKAKRIHTEPGYFFRAAWPFFTLTAFWLFWFCNKDGLRRADIYITYILLAATFLLDMRWLLRALGSTWTYAFLKDKPRSRLHHGLLCTGRWHRLRRVVVSLDPGHLVLFKEPTSYRLWSGRIGQYNLLHECTHDTASPIRTLAEKLRLEDCWKDYQYHYSRGLDIPECVRKKLFERIWAKLKLAYRVRKEVPEKPKPAPPKIEVVYEYPPDDYARRSKKLDDALGFDPEFQEDILVLHIATDIFLLRRGQNAASGTNVKAIEALSNYMLFLVAVRPYMLPGHKLSRLHKATSVALQGIWHKVEGKKTHNPCSRERECQLAGILQNMEIKDSPGDDYRPGDDEDKRSLLYDSSIILSDGTRYAEVLLRWGKCKERLEMDKILEAAGIWGKSKERLENPEMDKILKEVGIGGKSKERLERLIPKLWAPKNVEKTQILLMEIIFDVWVHRLIYVSVRCSRESHAKQLSRGGELTTIVWILAEHASVFGIREDTRRPTEEHTQNSGREHPPPCSVM